MTNPTINTGNGLILYFRTGNFNDIRQNVEKMGGPVEKDIHLKHKAFQFYCFSRHEIFHPN